MAWITETLPIEAMGAIIKTLAAPILDRKNHRGNSPYDDALTDLKACSLACRNFLPLCQKYIFNAIELETHDRMNGSTPQSLIGRFAEIVETSPIIGTYVRKVTVWITPHPNHNFAVYYHPSTVASALRALTKLETILLTPGNVNDSIAWNNIPSSLISDIDHLFQLPTIANIGVFRVRNFNICSFVPCVGLEYLTLHDCWLDEKISNLPSTPVSIRQVRLFLQNLSKDNRIQVLEIIVEYLPTTSDFVDDLNWDNINNTLLNPGWSSLTKIDLQVTTITDRENLPQAITRAAILKNFPETRLQGLSSSKSFKFIWSLKSIVKDPRGSQYTANL